MRAAAVYCVLLGVLMICQWLFFVTAGRVPEAATAPVELAFHLAAELATAAALIVGGLAVLRGAAWGRWLAVLALGMVAYSVIVSAGYFAQQSGWALVAMFAVLLVGSLASLSALVRPVETDRGQEPTSR